MTFTSKTINCGLSENDSPPFLSFLHALQPSVQSADLFPSGWSAEQLIGRETIQSSIKLLQSQFAKLTSHKNTTKCKSLSLPTGFFELICLQIWNLCVCTKCVTCSFRRICLRTLRPIPCKRKRIMDFKLQLKGRLGTPPQKKNGICWEFFPSVGPPPPPFWEPLFQKKSVVYFAF